MGSTIDLPDATSPSLILTHPTGAEKHNTWTSNYVEWGGPLGLKDYLAREPYLENIPLAENGGMVHWILTDKNAPAGGRPILASCETIRKKVWATDPGKEELREGIAYGVGSVFTEPQYRGNQYASRMITELGKALELGFEESEGKIVKPIASALWSDIGKVFYAKKGWPVFASVHVAFSVPGDIGKSTTVQGVGDITYENLDSFCRLDEELLRRQMSGLARNGKTAFAFIPNHDIFRWHLLRDDFIANRVLKDPKHPNIKGAVAGAEGKRVWAVWIRSYPGDPAKTENNTMYILRLGIENEAAPVDDLTASFSSVLRQAQVIAGQWNLGKIEIWNPTPAVNNLIEKSGYTHEVVDRDTGSIPSLRWFGECDTSKVDWVANEKYCWS
jgi:hypothetical protein